MAFEGEDSEVFELGDVFDPDGVGVEFGESLEDGEFDEMDDVLFLKLHVVDFQSSEFFELVLPEETLGESFGQSGIPNIKQFQLLHIRRLDEYFQCIVCEPKTAPHHQLPQPHQKLTLSKYSQRIVADQRIRNIQLCDAVYNTRREEFVQPV